MLVDVKVPQLAESVSEATLASWQKGEGEAVEEGENLIDVETDKIVLEVTAPGSGVLKELKKKGGDDVTSDEVIATIDTEAQAGAAAESGGAQAQAPQAAAASPSEQPPSGGAASQASAAAPAASASERQAQPARSSPPQSQSASTAAAGDTESDQAKDAKLSPAVRRLLDEHDLHAGDIEGTGKDGRITKSDVLGHLDTQAGTQAEARDEAPQPAPASQTEPPDERPHKRVPMTRLRRRVAERLLAAQRDNAILTTFNEVDMQPIRALRSRYQERFEKVHGVRLGFMSFFVLAALEALKRFPVVNASVDGEDIVYHGYFDIGIAVSSPRGLVVPILRDADRMNVADIEKAIGELGRKSRDNELTLEDLTGGNFTITNGGVFGSLLSTPILNPPQSAILGMHKIEERPVVRDGEIVARPMMYLALSYDHRIVDGREAVEFLVTVKEQIEDPSRLLLKI